VGHGDECLIGRRSRPMIVGHRGSMYRKLENTLDSFRAAAEDGCDAVELDAFLLKDGNLVVFHGDGGDANPGYLSGYCGFAGNILDYTTAEARQLNFNPDCPEFPCPREELERGFIPTLEEVLVQAKELGTIVKIELKGPGTEIPCLELVERMNMVDQCHFSSFDHSRVARIRALRQEKDVNGQYVYKTGCLFSEVPDNFIEMATVVGASEVHLKYDTCTTDRVLAIHDAGMGSMAWFRGPPGMRQDVTDKYLDVGNEDESMYRTVLATGVQAICLNKPYILHHMIQRQYEGAEEAIQNVS
jgi:glycerophosphoryl diester phosphodiesterase